MQLTVRQPKSYGLLELTSEYLSSRGFSVLKKKSNKEKNEDEKKENEESGIECSYVA